MNDKRSRGRPKEQRSDSGEIAKGGGLLVRAVIVLAAVEKGRAEGKTLRSAIEWTVADLKKEFPGEKISASEVKRILHQFQPSERTKAKEHVFRSATSDAGEFQVTLSKLPKPRQVKKKTIRFGRSKNRD